MTGSELIEKVRLLSKNYSHDSYEEINQAYEEICEITNTYWVSKTEEGLLTFEPNVSEYYLDFSDFRSLRNIYLYGEYNGETRWRQLREVNELVFETKRREFLKSTGDDETDLPIWYKLEGAPITKITVTPTPDQAYETRLHYTAFPEEIGPDTVPVVPKAYHRKIAMLAAGFVMQMSDDPQRIAIGVNLANEARRSFRNLLRDTKPNRTGRLQPPQIRFAK
jgi:hypothetical protein